MNRERIAALLQEFSQTIDNETLSEFITSMTGRLQTKRKQCRTGWELMSNDQMVALFTKALANTDKDSSNYYVDLANILMFCRALEIPPAELVNSLGGVFGKEKVSKPDTDLHCKSEKVEDCPKDATCSEAACPHHYAEDTEDKSKAPEPKRQKPKVGPKVKSGSTSYTVESTVRKALAQMSTATRIKHGTLVETFIRKHGLKAQGIYTVTLTGDTFGAKYRFYASSLSFKPVTKDRTTNHDVGVSLSLYDLIEVDAKKDGAVVLKEVEL